MVSSRMRVMSVISSDKYAYSIPHPYATLVPKINTRSVGQLCRSYAAATTGYKNPLPPLADQSMLPHTHKAWLPSALTELNTRIGCSRASRNTLTVLSFHWFSRYMKSLGDAESRILTESSFCTVCMKLVMMPVIMWSWRTAVISYVSYCRPNQGMIFRKSSKQ